MTQLKHTIYLLVSFGLLFLGLSYAISVNMEIGFWAVDSNYISNNFLFTCFSGVFASILVLLITEIFRFAQNQKDFEKFLFSQLALIYSQLQIAHTNIYNRLNKPEIIPNNLLEQLAYTINQITPLLSSLDYTQLLPTNKTRIITGIINRLESMEVSLMNELSHECIYLPIAIATDKIELLNQGISNPIITSFSLNTRKVLNVLLQEISKIKSKVSFDITELNTVCDNRFHWNELEREISNIQEPDSSLEKFLSNHNQ